MSVMPPTVCRFLPGTPAEPPRAGITAMVVPAALILETLGSPGDRKVAAR